MQPLQMLSLTIIGRLPRMRLTRVTRGLCTSAMAMTGTVLRPVVITFGALETDSRFLIGGFRRCDHVTRQITI